MLILVAVTLRPRASAFLTGTVLLLVSTANYYVYAFRGSELHPSDFITVGTALNVIGRYSFTLPGNVLYAWIGHFLFHLIGSGLPDYTPEKKGKKRASAVLASAMMAALLVFAGRNIPTSHFTHGGSYYNGFLLNFTLQIRETIVHKPAGYSPEALSSISGSYPEEEGGSSPDIIVIMDEACSDLGVLGELNTSIPVTPFIDSLKENTVRGYVLSSVYGGGTPNSEYEFLTGNSLLFVN
jgi:phosphoglycerol transferase MdoB-like AlkP superfamily enzyme